MTALKQEAIHLVEQMPEEQIAHIIEYIYALKDKESRQEEELGDTSKANFKMEAFLELEKMLIPASQELDYDKELAEARDEKYGYID